MNNCDKHFSQQDNWHGKSKQGCIFAAFLISQDPEESNVRKLCYSENLNETLLIKMHDEVIKAIADTDVFAIRFLLPQLTTKEHLQEFIELAKSHTTWEIEDSEVYNDLRLVKCRVPFPGQVDDKQNQIVSWALGFGPFVFYPDTRQSPHFEFMLPVKSKQFLKDRFKKFSLTQHAKESHDRGGEPHEAHLADIYIPTVTDNVARDNQMWESSQNRKQELLTKGGNIPYDDHAAKAKITFSYKI